MPGSELPDEKSLQFNAVYEVMSQAYREEVVSRALSFRGNLSSEASSALNSAIQKSRIRVNGYRAPHQAPHTLLRGPISQILDLHPELAGAVLRAWAESQSALRDKIADHLKNAGLAAEYPDFQAGKFRRRWPIDDWRSQRDKFIQENVADDISEDDAALMLCFVTGRVPVAAGESEPDKMAGSVGEYLDQFLDILKALPPTAPDWRDVIPNFIESVSLLVKEKEAELEWAEDFDAVLRSLRDEFAELLSFFEQDTQGWAAEKVSREADTAAALRSAEKLLSLLTEYRPIHDRAPSISEERERIRQRDELQPLILETAQELERLMTEPPDGPGPNRPAPPKPDVPAGSAAPAPVEPPPVPEPSPSESPQEARTAAGPSQAETHAAAELPGVSTTEYAALQSENQGLRDNVTALQSENDGLRDEVEILKTELYDSQEMEESWRLAYLSEREGLPEGETDAGLKVESVNAAVELARQRFRRELTFAPNSESNIASNPFMRPEKVWEALQWLATTYYKSKMGQLRVTNFDQSIKEACGWWYKGDQGETTLSRYRKSYTANAFGKTYRLAEHIGKGTNFDARYTIRIAFNWDDDLRQVIIGYIGRHQQTDAS